MRLISILAAASTVLMSCAGGLTEARPSNFICQPPPENAGTQFIACETLEDRPDVTCCVYNVNDCASVLCRLTCESEWLPVVHQCDLGGPGELETERLMCVGNECV